MINLHQSAQSIKPAKKQRGFTLLELLIVISIIGILMALGVVAYSTAQRKGRDAKRRADVQAVSNALEQYYSQNVGYPTASDCSGLTTGLTTDYLPSGMPTDPKGGVALGYTCDSQDDTYCICAVLETGGGNASGEADADNCPYSTAEDLDYYCVSSLQ